MAKRLIALILTVCLLTGSALAFTQEEVEPISQDEVALTAFMEDALSVYSWFVLWPLGGDPEEPSEEGDKYRVLDDRFDTWEELSDFLLGYFSPDILWELFDMGLYEEINGYMYVSDEFTIRNEDIDGETFSVTAQDEDEITITATVRYVNAWEDRPDETYEFTLTRTDAGWAFTAFPFYW